MISLTTNTPQLKNMTVIAETKQKIIDKISDHLPNFVIIKDRNNKQRENLK